MDDERPAPRPDDLDAVALRIHQLASVVGVMAAGLATRLDPDQELSHALHLVEENLLEVEERVEALRRRTVAAT